MKVSVLMAVYRTDEARLKASIESVLAQTFRDFEFLILDDCPEDDRECVVKRFTDARIVYAKNERNLGISATRNRLLEVAKGDYLAILDHDDVCRADRLEKEVAYLDAHPDCGVVSSGIREMPQGIVREYPTSDHEVEVRLVHDCLVQHSAAMIRKAALDEHGIRYEPAYSPCEDHALWVRLLPHVGFHILPEPLLDYHWHAKNVTRLKAAAMKVGSYGVHELAKATVPQLCHEYYAVRAEVTWVRLFGLPLVKIVRRGDRARLLLFDFIPVGTIRRATR